MRQREALAGWRDRHTYVEAHCMMSPDVLQGWGLYSGAIGDVVGIIYRPYDIPPMSFPDCVRVSPRKYCGPVFLTDVPKVAPIPPIKILDRRHRCSRTTAILRLHGTGPFTRAKGRLAALASTQSARPPALLRPLSKSRSQAAYTLPCPALFRPGAGSLASLVSRLLRQASRLSAAASASSFTSIKL